MSDAAAKSAVPSNESIASCAVKPAEVSSSKDCAASVPEKIVFAPTSIAFSAISSISFLLGRTALPVFLFTSITLDSTLDIIWSKSIPVSIASAINAPVAAPNAVVATPVNLFKKLSPLLLVSDNLLKIELDVSPTTESRFSTASPATLNALVQPLSTADNTALTS